MVVSAQNKLGTAKADQRMTAQAKYLPALAVLVMTFVASQASALVINKVVTNPGDPHLWTEVTFANTIRAEGPGDQLTMTTANARGIWFGNGASLGGANDPGWDLGTAASGNYLSLTADFSTNARDWSATLVDRDGYRAGFIFNSTHLCNPSSIAGCYTAPVNASLRMFAADPGNQLQTIDIALDLTVSHTYELLLKNGLVSYRVDGNLLFSGAAHRQFLTSPYPGQLTIGDGSGNTRTGAGSMHVSAIYLDTAPEMNSLGGTGLPGPGAVGLVVLGLIGIGARRLRA